MTDQIPAQPEQPGQVPPDKAEHVETPAAPPPESERGMSPETIASGSPAEASHKPLQDSAAEPPPEPTPAPEAAPQEPESTPEAQESFPCPFDEELGYEIVEPPDGEESDDGFASIPAGPTEEVNFEPPRVRGPRRRRDRARREPVRAGTPSPDREAAPAVKRFPIWLAVAGAVLLAAIIIVVILLVAHGR
jgi:hypothetical protein